MTATTIGQIAATSTPAYWAPAVTLAFLSGAMLLLMGVLRLGFFANFLSHPVISGFITASGLLIAASQLKTLMGVKAEGHNFLELIQALAAKIPNTHGLTLAVGVLTADIIARSGPIAAIAVTAWLAWFFNLAIEWPEASRHGSPGFAAVDFAAVGLGALEGPGGASAAD